MIIAGDIGGTKTNVALFATNEECPVDFIVRESYPSGDFSSLEEILESFLFVHKPHLTHACFGVAGPVVEGRVDATNLAWDVSEERLARILGVPGVKLVNDLEATAYGVQCLRPSQIFTLHEGNGSLVGHRALIAAGTGLGMAGLFWDGAHHHPMSSEGGHIDFAPHNELEEELLRYVREKIGGRVSYERVLSGPGIFQIYEFLRERGQGEEPAWLAEELKGGDPSAAVSRAALEGRSELAAEALDVFTSIYGAMAGDLVLLLKPAGGLYVGGGIAPKILEKLTGGTFMRSYLDKGRMTFITKDTPVRVILDDNTALYGAAFRALKEGA